MTIFTHPQLGDEYKLIAATKRQSFCESVLPIQQALQAARTDDRRISVARNRIATFRIPIDLLARLDDIADDAATSRGHMLRQIVAEYICYVEECDVRYKGSLLTAHASKRKR